MEFWLFAHYVAKVFGCYELYLFVLVCNVESHHRKSPTTSSSSSFLPYASPLPPVLTLESADGVKITAASLVIDLEFMALTNSCRPLWCFGTEWKVSSGVCEVAVPTSILVAAS